MKVGDVIWSASANRLVGFVIAIGPGGRDAEITNQFGARFWEPTSGLVAWGCVRNLTENERAIVNAAIAAEALRRMK